MLEEFGFDTNNDWKTLTNGTQIHKTALIAPWVRFDDNCIVYPYAIVGRLPDLSSALARQAHAAKILTIGKSTILGYHSIIYGNVKIPT